MQRLVLHGEDHNRYSPLITAPSVLRLLNWTWIFEGDENMGSSDCEICGENDYLKEYSLDEMPKNIYVCRNCVEEGIRLRMEQVQQQKEAEGLLEAVKKQLANLKKEYGA